MNRVNLTDNIPFLLFPDTEGTNVDELSVTRPVVDLGKSWGRVMIPSNTGVSIDLGVLDSRRFTHPGIRPFTDVMRVPFLHDESHILDREVFVLST